MADALLILTGRMPASEAQRVLERVRGEMPTIDRALTLVWLERALGGARASGNPLWSARSAAALVAPWQAEDSITGQRVYRLPPRTALPAALKLAGEPGPGLVAIVQYESRETEKSSLPLRLERRLYRMKRIDDGETKSDGGHAARRDEGVSELAAKPSRFELELLGANATLKTDEVYLDEIVLHSSGGAPLRFGVVEVPLPPGASVERGTWGIAVRFPGRSRDEAIDRASNEPTPYGYAVPIERIDGEVTVRHLLRVSERGTFALPPARYYRMYQPEEKALEEHSRARVEIR